MAGRMDDQDAQGLYPARPDQGARNLLDEPFGLGSAPVMYDSEQDDGHCTCIF